MKGNSLKYSAILLCVCMLLLFRLHSVQADEAQLNFTETPLRNVLNTLSDFYKINLIYNDDLIKNKNVTCDLNNLSIDSAFQQLLNTYNLTFKTINTNTYVIFSPPVIDIPNTEIRVTKKEENTNLIPPKVILDRQLSYPDLAKQKGFEGSVNMKIFINQNGDVKTVKIEKSSSSYILDHAAVRYAKDMKFQPAKLDDQAISVWSKWKIVFRLMPSDTTYTEFIINEDVE